MKEFDVEKIKEELRLKVDSFAEKVVPIYQLLGWTWAHPNLTTSKGIPDKDAIVKNLHQLIDGLREIDITDDYPHMSIASGGLRASYQVYLSNGRLSFVEASLDFMLEETVGEDFLYFSKEIK